MSKRFVNPASFASWCLVFLISLIWQPSVPVLAQKQAQVDLTGKNFLVIHTSEANVPIFLKTDKGLSTTLESGGISDLNQFFESLNLRLNPGLEYRKALVEKLRLQYGHRKVDVIITMYPEALEFVLKDCGDIFPNVPIIALYLQKSLALSNADRTIVEHTATLDITGTLEIALSLVPGVKRVYVVSGVHEVDRQIEEQARRDLKKWETRLEFHYLSRMPFEDMMAIVSNVPPGSILLLLVITQDVKGSQYTTPAVAQRLGQVSAAPIFGVVDTGLGYGIVGGSLLNSERIGSKAGELVLDFLKGILPPRDTSKILNVPPVLMFDWRQLRRWKLSEAALPKGSIVINKEFTLWDLKYYIIAAVAFLLLETALIIFLIIQRRRKKVAEESLRQKTEELDQFFNVSLDLLCIAKTEGYFLRLNPAWERILGYSREELMAKRFLDFVHPDDLDRTQEAISSLASQQKIFLFENRYRCKDGTYRWLQWSSVPAGKLIYAAARDITEHKRAEEALEDRLRFEGLVSHLSARFVNIPPDRVDSEIEDGLRQIVEFFRVDHSTLLRILPGKASFQITHDASSDGIPPVPVGVDLPRSIYPWAYETLAEKHEVMSISRLDDLPAEANVDRQTCIKWGIRSYVNIPILIGDSVGHIIHVSSAKSERVWPEELLPRLRLMGEIFINALERKQAEAEASNARRELLHVERSLRLNELTASLAHELNQPLSAILSNAQAALRFLKSEKPDLNEFQEILKDIISDDQRAGDVIRSLRSMMKREEGEKRRTILNDVLNDVIQIFRSEAIFRNVHIETECDGSLPPVFGDKGQLQQVVLNLIMNGAEAMSRNPTEQKKLILRTQRKDHSIWVAVRDFGPGIDKGNLERVFQPFFTTKRTGLGMGLAVCSSIIKAHRGHIWAENNPDGGATFFIELPISEKSGE